MYEYQPPEGMSALHALCTGATRTIDMQMAIAYFLGAR